MKHIEAIHAAAHSYMKVGWNTIPLKPKDKAPKESKWPNSSITKDDITQKFSHPDANIGLVLGDSSNRLIDVDLDCEEARLLAPDILPTTGAVFGRNSALSSHYLYVSKSIKKTQKFQCKDEGMLVELRSNGAQTMVPPSVHPCGERLYFVDEKCTAETVEAEEIESAVHLLAICSLALRYYPVSGSRNDVILALSGLLLLSNQWSPATIEKAVHAVASAAGDEEALSRVGIVAKTKEKLDKQEAVGGLSMLKEHFEDGVADQIGKWCRAAYFDEGELINEMNKKYAMIIMGGKAIVAKLKRDKETNYVSLETMDVTAFKHFLQNTSIQLPNMKKPVTHAEYWLSHPKRLTYEGVTFSPNEDKAGYFNYWQGFSCDAVEGDCSKFLKHTKDIICAGDETLYNYVLAFLANIVQCPEQKPGTAIAIRGKQGTGKSMWMKYFASLIEPYCVTSNSPRETAGQFNGHLQYCLLLHAEEGFFAGDKPMEAKLKDLITNDQINIEQKHKEIYSLNNYIRFVVTSNSSWLIPAGLEERRFLVLEAQPIHIQDTKYFGALRYEMQNGGKEALLHHLLNYDLSEIDLRKIPKTAALLEQKIASMDTITQYWMDVLVRGVLPMQDGWPMRVRTKDLVDNYIEHAKNVGAKRRSIETMLGMKLNTLIPNLTKKTGMIKHYAYSGSTDYAHTNGNFYELPSLEECRRYFEEEILGQSYNWQQ